MAFRHHQLVGHLGDLLIEIVDGFQPQAGEPLGRLATLSLLAGHQRGGGFDRLNAFALQPADVCLPTVEDNQAEQPLVEQHILQRFGQKRRITMVAERLDRLRWRLQHTGDHLGLTAAAVDRPGEDDDPVFGGKGVVIPQAVFDRGERVLDVCSGLFGFDV